MTSPVKTLENALYAAARDYLSQSHVDFDAKYSMKIYMSREFYMQFCHDVKQTGNQSMRPDYLGGVEFMGYPIYTVNHDNHPDFKIYVVEEKK